MVNKFFWKNETLFILYDVSLTKNFKTLKWKLHDTFIGSDEQSLLEQFDELCIIVHFLSPTSLKTLGKHSFYIPYMDLEDSYYEYKSGASIYCNGVQNDTLITVAVNLTNVKLVDAKTSSGSEVVNGLNVSKYSVYYR